MRFEEVLVELRCGGRIRREKWQREYNSRGYITLVNSKCGMEYLAKVNDSGRIETYLMGKEDLFSEDWELA